MNTTQERPPTRQTPRYGREGQPMNESAAAATQQLTPAPEVQPPPPPKPDAYEVEFLFETPEGFHVTLKGAGLAGRDIMAWIGQTSKGLISQGMIPVRRDVLIPPPVIQQPISSAAPGAGDGPYWIKGEGGAPPRCSAHGAGKWVEGDHKPPKTGHYAFWSCTSRDCRPKGTAV